MNLPLTAVTITVKTTDIKQYIVNRLYLLTSTKFVHSCVIQTKSNKFKQSLTKSKKVEKSLESIKVP